MLIRGHHFLYRCRAFVESKRLFKINFHDYLLCFFFPILHSCMCILLIKSLCTSFSDKENRFGSSQKIGSRMYLYEQHSRQSDGRLNNSLSQHCLPRRVFYPPTQKSKMRRILIWHLCVILKTLFARRGVPPGFIQDWQVMSKGQEVLRNPCGSPQRFQKFNIYRL